MVALAVACFALPRACDFVDARVRRIERVAVLAVGLAAVLTAGSEPAGHNVRVVGDCFKVQRVDTDPVPAEMVDNKSPWDGPFSEGVTEPMGIFGAPGWAALSLRSKHAVTGHRIRATEPGPALVYSGGAVDPRPEVAQLPQPCPEGRRKHSAFAFDPSSKVQDPDIMGLTQAATLGASRASDLYTDTLSHADAANPGVGTALGRLHFRGPLCF